MLLSIPFPFYLLIKHWAAGYREAAIVARARLEACAFDHASDPVMFRQDLLNIARTTLSSKILTQVCCEARVYGTATRAHLAASSYIKNAI